MYLAMVGIASLVFLSQFFMTCSMQYNSVGMVGIILYLAIPLGYILDTIVFGTTMDWMEYLGATIIVATNITIAGLRIKGVIE